jgi:hypothetical protein
MIVGKGQKSNKEYTAVDKELAFRQVISAVVKEQKRVDEIKKDSGMLIKETIAYWVDEYYEPGESKSDWDKEMKELFKIRIKEALKDDNTTRLAFERELILESEAGESREGVFA